MGTFDTSAASANEIKTLAVVPHFLGIWSSEPKLALLASPGLGLICGVPS